jgi:hypothetical protein
MSVPYRIEMHIVHVVFEIAFIPEFMLTSWKRPDAVEVIRHQHPSIDVERTCNADVLQGEPQLRASGAQQRIGRRMNVTNIKK